MTLAILNCMGTMPVVKEQFIMCFKGAEMKFLKVFKKNIETPLKSSDFFGLRIDIASKTSDSVTGLFEKLSNGMSSSTELAEGTESCALTLHEGISEAILEGIVVKNWFR
jgi:hypothetical protein